MNPKDESFKKLQKTWYDKLAKDGFHDIEQDEDKLKRWTTGQKHDPTAEPKFEYYRTAGYFLHEYKFKNALEEKVWSYYAEGLSHREIAKELKNQGIKMGKMSAWRILHRLELEMYKMYGNHK